MAKTWDDKFECESGGLDAVSWVEVASRVFRVKIFVVPARDTARGRSRKRDWKQATCAASRKG